MENKMKKAITFFYNHHSGELVKTKIHKNFQEVNSLMEADVLLDCIAVLKGMYKNSLVILEDCIHTQMEEVAEDKDSGILSGYRHCLDCDYVEWYSDNEEPCEPEE
jgi:hypothetical protein